jgi:hypothetical protein
VFRSQFSFHGDYAEYAFSSTAPDPRLAATPAPSPQP